MKFFEDCKIDSADIFSFYMCKIFGSKEDFSFEKDGFTAGMSRN